MFGYVSKREHEAVVAERDTLRRTALTLELTNRSLTTALAEARAKQPQRGDKGRFVGVGK